MVTQIRSTKEAETFRTRSLGVMKYLGTAVIFAAIIFLLGKPQPKPDKNPLVHIPPVTQKVYAEQPSVKPSKPPEAAKPVVTQPTVVTPPTPAPVVSDDCVGAMHRQWPESLWSGAQIVLDHENRSHNASIKGLVNSDGSQDFGCFQINDKAHPAFFANHNWADADQNAAYAYQIYKGRGNWTAWYAVEGILY